jgi:hypothetical protein
MWLLKMAIFRSLFGCCEILAEHSSQKFIETFPKRGYKFTGDVRDLLFPFGDLHALEWECEDFTLCDHPVELTDLCGESRLMSTFCEDFDHLLIERRQIVRFSA